MKYLRRALVFAAAVVLVFAAVFYFSAANKYKLPVVGLAPGDISWNSDPKLHGLDTAVLVGGSSAGTLYAQRIRIPAGRKLAPHSHPNRSGMVTVLSGTLYFAYGDKFDETKLKEFPAGSFFTEPKGMPHYALTKAEEAVLQLDAIGSDGTVYVK